MAVAALGLIIEDYMAETSTRRQALCLRDEPSSQVFEPVWALLVTTSHGLGNLIAIFIGASDAPRHASTPIIIIAIVAVAIANRSDGYAPITQSNIGVLMPMVPIALIIGRPVDDHLLSRRRQGSTESDRGRTGNNYLPHLCILLNFPDDQPPKWNIVPAC